MADEKQGTRGELAPFQIKAFSVEVRKRIVAAAANEKTTVGEWVEQAALNQLERERGQLVMPPSPPAVAAPPLPQPCAPPQAVTPFDFAGLAQLLGVLGDQAPDALRRDAVASTRAVLRQARGLAPPRPRTQGPRKAPQSLIEHDGGDA